MRYQDHEIDNTAVYGLVDCNQFYVSCERAFAPHLEGQPVGVLSNNDGCLVALSPELKALGVPRGMPGFKIRDIVGNNKIYLFSSNYELYGDMSARVMRIITSMSDDIEVYSIDEAFTLFNNVHASFNLLGHVKEVREKVKQQTGIPVSIGLARTKTLAKIANKIAKKSKAGIFDLTDPSMIENVLKRVDIADVWGIGRQHTKRLIRYGIYTAYDFMVAPAYKIRKEMSVCGERTQLELKGVPCISMEVAPPTPRSIVCSRSFGKPVGDINEMIEASSTFCTKAMQNLRKKNQVARTITVFISTNPFKDTKQYANYASGSLLEYSAYTPDFIAIATALMKKIFRNGYLYKKVGVMLTDMIDKNRTCPSLFDHDNHRSVKQQAMVAIDSINDRFGKDIIFFASSGVQRSWSMRREMVSPRCTTRWGELLRIVD